MFTQGKIMSNKQVILLLLNAGIVIRNLINDDFLKSLSKSYKIVCISSYKKVDWFPENNSDLVWIESKIPKVDIITKILNASLYRRFDLIRAHPSINILKKGPISNNIYEFFLNILAYPFPRSKNIFKFLNNIKNNRKILIPENVQNIFHTYKPIKIISTRPNHLEDFYINYYANKLKITIFGVIKSCDNVTTKGYMPVRCDVCSVWNRSMKKHLIESQFYREREVFITGIPHIDQLLKSNFLSRKAFFDKMNLDKNKKTIFYATSPPNISPDDPEIIRKFIPFLKNKNFQMIVRLHQIDNFERFKEIKSKSIHFLKRGESTDTSMDKRLLSRSFIKELKESIYHSDITINTSSTITFECLALGKEVININFDLIKREPYKSTKRFTSLIHYNLIIENDFVAQAMSFDELIDLAFNYQKLKRNSLDYKKKEIDREIFYKLDGKSNERLAKAIMKF